MDPIEAIDLDSDSSFVLALESLARGHRLFTYHPSSLVFRDGSLTATARPVLALRREHGNHVDQGPTAPLDLAGCDVVLVRQNPPFDMAYVTTTHLLETLPPTTLVVNDPRGIRDSPEKLLVLRFTEFMPPTAVAADAGAIDAFRAEHGTVVLKPVYGHGGDGVLLLGPDDPNLGPMLDLLGRREPVIVQKYLPEVVGQGDRRIVLVDGEPVGAIDRLPPEGGFRSNLVTGGTATGASLSDRDREICAAIGPELRRRGLLLAGIDVIAGHITEINVTSPTGLPSIERFDGISVGAVFWDRVEARLAEVRAAA